MLPGSIPPSLRRTLRIRVLAWERQAIDESLQRACASAYLETAELAAADQTRTIEDVTNESMQRWVDTAACYGVREALIRAVVEAFTRVRVRIPDPVHHDVLRMDDGSTEAVRSVTREEIRLEIERAALLERERRAEDGSQSNVVPFARRR